MAYSQLKLLSFSATPFSDSSLEEKTKQKKQKKREREKKRSAGTKNLIASGQDNLFQT